MKPPDYQARRTWQNEARARGDVPECGREACHEPADPAWLNHHTPLLYCARCAALINKHNPGFCYPEATVKPDLTIANDAQTPKRIRPGKLLLASLLAFGAGVDPSPGMPEPRPAEPNPDRGRHRKKSERRWERKAEQARERRDGAPYGCEWIPGDGGSRG